MDQTTTSTQADGGSTTDSTSTSGNAGTVRHTRRRAFLAMGAAAVLAAGVGAGAFASKSGPFAAKAKPTTSTFNGATDTITKGDLQGHTSVTGTLRYSDSRKFKSGFEGVLIQVPASGTVLTQGDVLYRTGTETAYLMRGSLPAWRSFEAGMEDGEDIRQLETALRDLGYFDYEPDDHFSWATTSAIMKWQKELDMPQTGTIPLGRVVFTSGDMRVGTVTARLGDRVAADTELYDVTSTTQVVDANIKLSDQKLAVVGTTVTIKLPDAKTTTGTITSVGTPTEKSSGSGAGSGSGSGSG
ncbi:peptidoglycan-binding protein, partial [Actinomyces naeslundii]|uniref:peptidoglycan-binding domain-containing protein n=1 Tax=Actinomyces naeslundii TaxID=1655 RepID=UPI003C6EEABB